MFLIVCVRYAGTDSPLACVAGSANCACITNHLLFRVSNTPVQRPEREIFRPPVSTAKVISAYAHALDPLPEMIGWLMMNAVAHAVGHALAVPLFAHARRSVSPPQSCPDLHAIVRPTVA